MIENIISIIFTNLLFVKRILNFFLLFFFCCFQFKTNHSKIQHLSTKVQKTVIHRFWITFGFHKFIHILWKTCGKVLNNLCTTTYPHFNFPLFSTLFALFIMLTGLFTLTHIPLYNFLLIVNNIPGFPHL